MAVDVLATIAIERPVSVVAAYAGDPTNAPSWSRRIDRAEWLTEPPVRLGSRVRFDAAFLGRAIEYVYEIVELTVDEQMTMRSTDGPFPMRTTYTWRPLSDRASHMAIRNTGGPTGPAAIAAPLVARAVRWAVRQDLAELKRILESS